MTEYKQEDTEMAHATPQDEMIAAEEAVIADAQFVIHNLMADAGVSRADLARELGVSQARVTQMFSDEANNLTLRTLGRVFRVLGQECRITCDRWEAILAKASECAEQQTNSAATDALIEHAAKSPTRQVNFAAMLDLTSALEGFSIRAYETETSNDNFQREAVAA
jgi:DNA-binding Xre family transcriptional regulator